MFAHNLRKTLCVVFGLLAGCSADSCHDLAAKDAITAEYFVEGCRLLEECEDEPSASAENLMLLALCYADESLVQDRQSGLRKSWDLIERAALTGNEDAIVTLASLYLVGDDKIGYDPKLSVADCLLAVTADESLEISPGESDSNAVADCLTNAP